MILAAAGNFGLSYILEIVGLVIAVLLIAKYIAPPLNGLMNKRLGMIKGQLTAGEDARVEAARLVAERKQTLEDANAEAVQIVELAKKSAELLVVDGKRRAEEEYERLVARIALEVEATRLRARQEVLTSLGVVVLAAAEIVVRAELDSTSHHRLIDEAISATEAESTEAVV